MKDQFALDNRAWTVARKNRPANVLLSYTGLAKRIAVCVEYRPGH